MKEYKGTLSKPITYTYRGVVAKENPLVADSWLVQLGQPYGSYFCEGKAGVRDIVKAMLKHQKGEPCQDRQ